MNGIVVKRETILRRHCPTSPMHWRVDEPNGRCPVCRAKIAERVYVPLDAVVRFLEADMQHDLADKLLYEFASSGSRDRT